MKRFFILSLVLACLISCNKNLKKTQPASAAGPHNEIRCNENGCKGTYAGPEFINGADIAHQFSNKMSRKVGDMLKDLYQQADYKKVDFSKIIMTTKGMGSGDVTYYLSIPFIKVKRKCDAFTSFDHVGGWNHSPELIKRKEALSTVLMVGHQLDISDLKITAEGLHEYWIQWKNKDVQADCN